MNKKRIMKLKTEYKEISTRIDRLTRFVNTDEFTNLSNREKDMLLSQLHAMCVYCFVLGDRISYYEGKPLIFEWEVNVNNE